MLVVARGGHLAAHDGELLADRLSTPAQTEPIDSAAGVHLALPDVLVDERHRSMQWPVEFGRKKVDADRKIAFARFSSAFSRLSRFCSAESHSSRPAGGGIDLGLAPLLRLLPGSRSRATRSTGEARAVLSGRPYRGTVEPGGDVVEIVLEEARVGVEGHRG